MKQYFIYTFIISLIFSSCSDAKQYNVIYPIEASKQKVIVFDGARYLVSKNKNKVGIIVLSNPTSSFVDVALAIKNASDHNFTLNLDDIEIKTRKEILKKSFDFKEIFVRDDDLKSISPKMKSYGCFSSSDKNNITLDSMDVIDNLLFNELKNYKKDSKLKVEAPKVTIFSKSSSLVHIRFDLPMMSRYKNNTPIRIKFQINTKVYKFKFIVQKL